LAGIYIHIPFCSKACSYCDFYFSTQTKHLSKFVESLKTEIILRKYFFSKEDFPLQSIYFGGGTPSLLKAEQIDEILSLISSVFPISDNPEITLEGNPEDLSEERLIQFKEAGINRLSIGIQTLADSELKVLERIHNSEKSIQVLENVEKIYNNYSFDLIYGIPGQTIESLEKTLTLMLKFNPVHLSTYCLTVEKKTALNYKVGKGEIIMPDDENAFEQFVYISNYLEKKHYDHYETSNFALKDKKAIHNSSYWYQKPYLGLGPSAHGFKQSYRYNNISNIHQYSERINSGMLPTESEEYLEASTLGNEMLITRLRLREGMSIIQFNQVSGRNLQLERNNIIEKYILSEHLVGNSESIALTQKGRFIADKVILDLML
jgi:oxygen-independent coproporphyrinogen-3 oxidase